MKELSLNVLDIAQNSVSAGAKHILIAVDESVKDDKLVITIDDDGCGMDSEFLAQVADPFTTTRTTRKFGMGVPLFKMAAEMSGGSFEIESEKGKGTSVRAVFQLSHIDRPPLGDMGSTVSTLVWGSPDIDFTYRHTADENSFEFSTVEAREALGGVPLNEPDVIVWITGYVNEGDASVSA